MIEDIPAMIDSGVSALKIEGRMRGTYYLAPVELLSPGQAFRKTSIDNMRDDEGNPI